MIGETKLGEEGALSLSHMLIANKTLRALKICNILIKIDTNSLKSKGANYILDAIKDSRTLSYLDLRISLCKTRYE